MAPAWIAVVVGSVRAAARRSAPRWLPWALCLAAGAAAAQPAQPAQHLPVAQALPGALDGARLAQAVGPGIGIGPAAGEGLRSPDDGERLQVAAPFIELHTGPGRGYPVFHVAERGAWIQIELRRTDWYRVRVLGLANAPVGWVDRAQLESTLTEYGEGKTFRDVVVDDYLKRRFEFGLAYGRMKADPMLKVFGAWRFSDTLGVELSVGQVQGNFAGTDYWHLDLVSEPWSDRRLSPYLSVGLGRFHNLPNTSLVSPQPVNAKMGHAGLGLKWYLSDRFVARVGWSIHAAFVSDARSIEYQAVQAGISFFF